MSLRYTFRTPALLAPAATAAAAALLTSGASAAVYQYSLSFANGYVAEGQFSTKASAPASFIESNPTLAPAPYATTYLESQTMRVLQNGAVLDQSTTVFSGVCSDIYLYLDFSSVGGPAIAGMDLSTVDPEATSYYFVSNSKDPSGAYGAYGSTGYNLFRSDVATSQDVYIGTATSLTVTAVPAPGALAVLAAAGAGVGVGRRRRAPVGN
ncbi:MAG: hypothetical protein RI986_538 [Planctomycetota bacterium]|jgi:hypothetical protein